MGTETILLVSVPEGYFRLTSCNDQGEGLGSGDRRRARIYASDRNGVASNRWIRGRCRGNAAAGSNGEAHDSENQQRGQPAQFARRAAHETHQEQARECYAYWPWTSASVFGRR